MSIEPAFCDFLMQAALEQARIAFEHQEVPVGAVVAVGAAIIGRGRNRIEELRDPTAHAEIEAIRAGCAELKNWRLAEAVLCVTLEPCTMCLGASKLARIPTIIFGARDSRFGAIGSVYDLSGEKKTGPIPKIVPAIREEECRELIRSFFALRRDKNGGGSNAPA